MNRVLSRVALILPALRGARSAEVVAPEDPVVTPLPSAANSLALIAAKVVAMGLGFVFWLLAARVTSPAQVGLAAGAVSAMMLCTQVAILGLGSAVITHLKGQQQRLTVLLNSSLTLVVCASAVVSLAFVAIAGAALGQLALIAHSPSFAALFVAAAVFGTLGILLDQCAVALRRGDQALIRNAAFGAATVLSLAAAALTVEGMSARTVFAAWAVAGLLATLIGLRQLQRAVRGYRPQVSVDGTLSRRLVRSALPNYVLTLAERAPGLLLPVVVTEFLSPETNATWYGVWMMAWVVYIVPVQIGLTVFSEVARDPTSQSRAVRRGVRQSLGFGLPLAAFAAVAAQPLLSLLGEHYAIGGVTPLRILVLGWIPLTFVHCFYASARAQRRLGEAVAVAAVSAGLSVTVAAVAGVTGGLTAMASAWLGAQAATGLWAGLRLWWLSRARAVTQEAVWTPTVPAERPLPEASERDRDRLVGRTTDLAARLLPVAALVIAAVSLREADLAGINDYGLVSVLPVGYYGSLALLASGFVLALRGRERTWLLTLQMLIAIVLLFGVTLAFEAVPRFNVVYRHAGVVDYLLHGGPIDATIDAYFNWPGFFVLVEFLVDLAGLDSVLSIASYAPVVFNLLALPAVVVIAKAATDDWRTAWVGVWIYYLSNWVGQDYLAPQAYAFLLYLTLAIALLVSLRGRVDGRRLWWRRSAAAVLHRAARVVGAAPDPVEVARPTVTWVERAGVVLACTVVLAAMVGSHQLTPFAALAMMLTLIVVRRTTVPLLPVIGVLLLATWLTFMATEYLGGHLRDLISDLLNVESAVTENLGQRVAGSQPHLVVVYIRLAATGVLWLLAAFGIARMLRHGRSAPSHALLAFTPLVLVPLQPYGGEVLLRAYLFALPFASVLVAWALFPGLGATWSWWRTTALLLVTCVLMGSFLFTRFGNERAYLFTAAEREAIVRLYDIAAPGDVLVAGSAAIAWKDREYTQYEYETVNRLVQPPTAPESPLQLADRVARILENESGDGRSYLIITRSQRSYDDMMGAQSWGSIRALEAGVLESPLFEVVYENPDARVFAVQEEP